MAVQNLTPRQLAEELYIESTAIFQETFAQQQENTRQIWWRDFVVEETTDDVHKDAGWFKLSYDIKLSKRKVAPIYEELTAETHRIFTERYTHAVRADKYDLIKNSGAGRGEYLRALEQFAMYAPQFPQDLLIDLLINGDTSQVLVWDGLPLFDNAHPRGGTTFDNLLAGALSETTFQAARTAMMRFPSDEGASLPMRTVPTDLIVPPDLEYTAKKLMNDTQLPGGSNEESNPIQGMANVRMDARFTDVDDWYLIDNSPSRVRPFTYLTHSVDGSPQTRNVTSEDFDSVYINEEFRWEMKWQMGISPNRPEQFIKVVN